MSETLFEGKVDELKSADPELIVPSPNGNRVAVVMPSGTVSLWNVVTGSRLLQLDGASAAVVSIDHEDARVAAVNREHAISIYRIMDGQLEKSLIPDEMSRDTYCRGLAFSPDDSQLIFLRGMYLSLWEIRKPTLLWQRKVGSTDTPTPFAVPKER